MHGMGPRGYKHYFLGINFTQKMPESPDSMYSSIFMLENICYHNFTWTHSFPMHPFSTPWKHQKTLPYLILCFERVEKGCIGNEWVKKISRCLKKHCFIIWCPWRLTLRSFEKWEKNPKNNGTLLRKLPAL